MALPRTVAARVLVPGDLLGTRMSIGTGGLVRTFWWRLDDAEPAKVEDFSLGTANAQAAAGTGWNEIFKSGTNQSYLEPTVPNIINQFWWGISPTMAWCYLQYPPSTDRLNLVGSRSVGDANIGYWTGRQTSPSVPAPETESYSMFNLHPAFNGYHPYLEPASITVRLTVWVWRFAATLVSVTLPDESAPQGVPGVIGRTVMRSIGGLVLVPAPTWVTDLASRRPEWAAKLGGSASSQPIGQPQGGLIRAESAYGYGR